MKNKQLISQFKLPFYISGKSFADASKIINSKFEGRNDIVSTTTKNELLKRLSQAQEYLKSQEQQVQQNQMAGGGFADSTIGQAFGNDATGEQKSKAFGAGINTLVSGIDLAKTAFSTPNIDTSGQMASEQINSGAIIGGNALKGAQAGMAFGPVGAGVGALVGGVAGLLGSGKAKKAMDKNTNNFTTVTNRRLSDNYFAMGGNVNQFGDGTGTEDPFTKYNKMNLPQLNMPLVQPLQQSFINKGIPINNAQAIIGTKVDGDFGKTQKSDSNVKLNNYRRFKGMTNIGQPLSAADYTAMGLTSDGYKVNKNAFRQQLPENLNLKTQNVLQGFKDYNYQETSNEKKESNKTNPLDFLKNNSDLLRYAPAVTNALQLKNLKKPTNVTLDKLSNRYKPTYTDLAQQQNIVNQELNNVNSAIQQSGASQGQSRAAMLAAQLNKTKALSSAYMNAEQQNAQQDNIAQQFNLGVDQVNLQQSNSQQDINDRNMGAYDTQKSQLISQIGNDLGGIGKEQLFKQYPKMMGLGYNWNGKYFVNNKGDIKTQEEAQSLETIQKSKGGYLNQDVLNHINNMYTKRNSK